MYPAKIFTDIPPRPHQDGYVEYLRSRRPFGSVRSEPDLEPSEPPAGPAGDFLLAANVVPHLLPHRTQERLDLGGRAFHNHLDSAVRQVPDKTRHVEPAGD